MRQENRRQKYSTLLICAMNSSLNGEGVLEFGGLKNQMH